jgi:pyruvate dehydrogenase E2 component (dihydrolipoamide acetyltransferase)
VLDADRKSLAQLDEEIARLTERAAELSPPELAGATFTLSYPGALGVASSTPVIVPPQAAALAAGAVRAVAVVRDGAIVPGHAMTITLACDHRILYGSRAARFLTRIKALLEEARL